VLGEKKLENKSVPEESQSAQETGDRHEVADHFSTAGCIDRFERKGERGRIYLSFVWFMRW
jgi:hypothetical protein